MAQYAIGDLQGCYDPFRRLLDRIDFDPDTDRLWLTGDIVNRGPRSRKTLRYVKSLGDAVVMVLGNHDLHLIALANGIQVSGAHYDSLRKILRKPDRDELIDWLRSQRLAYFDEGLKTLMVHAGLPPEWSVDDAVQRAAEVEAILQSDGYPDFLEDMYGDKPRKWKEEHEGNKRMRYIVNALTRMRMIDEKNRIDFSHTGSPDKAAANLTPWYDAANARWRGTRIVFGHWSALGLKLDDELIGLDTGCVWGGRRTAVCLNRKPKVFSVKCRD
jgi:bis(5'-nucleosyl)-tetraphosphatase (symmetrical)